MKRPMPTSELFIAVRDRALECLHQSGIHGVTVQTLAMDLMNAHDDVGLDFAAMFAASRDGAEHYGDFAHDIAGIVGHMDRNTGKLGGCFLPRFALKEDRRHVA